MDELIRRLNEYADAHPGVEWTLSRRSYEDRWIHTLTLWPPTSGPGGRPEVSLSATASSYLDPARRLEWLAAYFLARLAKMFAEFERAQEGAFA